MMANQLDVFFYKEFEKYTDEKIDEKKSEEVYVDGSDEDDDTDNIAKDVEQSLKTIEDFCQANPIPVRTYNVKDATDMNQLAKPAKKKRGRKSGWTEFEETGNKGKIIFLEYIYNLSTISTIKRWKWKVRN